MIKNNSGCNAAFVKKDKGKVTVSEWLSLVSITSFNCSNLFLILFLLPKSKGYFPKSKINF